MVNDVISGYQYRRQEEDRLASMGKHLERKASDVGFEDCRPGCVWGILHILDYHLCHSPKKLPPRRKHGRGKHVRCKPSEFGSCPHHVSIFSLDFSLLDRSNIACIFL